MTGTATARGETPAGGAPTRRDESTRGRRLEVLGLALLAYVPFLLSSPGKVAADTKQYLYLDPGSLLGRALSLWDPHVAAGTVPHQQIGYLFPMGPYYWLMDTLGVPDWIAQRLWMGTISLLAVLGARWLFTRLGARRWGALAGALVYMLTPYQLAFTARLSVLLLAWASLPWIVGLTMRAVQRGGWLDPALLALIIMSAGSVNASSMLFMLVAPALWIVLELCTRRERLGSAAAAVGRIAVLTAGASTWWVIGLRLQGKYGLPVLQLTENLHVVALRSTPLDLLRGIGNWIFYGTDRLGDSIDQAHYYVTNHVVELFSFAVPVLALAAAAIVRWKHRTYFVLLVVVGTVIGVGSWPYDDATLYGRVWRAFSDNSALGLALRNTPRVAPLIVLGLAGLLAGAVSVMPTPRKELLVGAVVAIVAFGALLPVWKDGYLTDRLERPESVPQYWKDAAAALDREGDATRVFEIPGANFSAYRWGNTVEPITPGLIDRPYLAKEVLPYGSPQTVSLLDAIDRRMQEGTFEPSSLAPVARLFGVGTVALRSDLEYERFGLARPQYLWGQLTSPAVAPGLDPPVPYGPTTTNATEIPLIDELTLRDAGKAQPPAVALFDVKRRVPIVHTAPSEQPVVLAGDGDGIVDAAAAGLIDGNQLVQQVAAMSDAELAAALRRGADLVVTDSNRRRAQSWFTSLRDDKGATERAGQTLPDPYKESYRLDVFPGSGDDSRTVVVQHGGTVDATADGGTEHPEYRAAYAFDGNPSTAWRIGSDVDPVGQELVLHTDHPTRADHVTLLQPQTGDRNRTISRVTITVNDGAPVTVDLGPESLTAPGQVVNFPATDVRSLVIRTDATTTPAFDPGATNPVGFAEVGLDDVRVTETVRLPVDLTQRVGSKATDHALDYVLSRLRVDPSDSAHQDPELALRRQFVVPDARDFGVAGTVRVNPNASDAVIDAVLGTAGDGATYSSSGHLRGDADARASRAFDGQTTTAWTAPLGDQTGQWVGVDLTTPISVSGLDLGVVADGRHSIPTQVHLEVDGQNVQTIKLPEIADSAPGGQVAVPVTFAPVTGKNIRLVVDTYRPVNPDGTATTGAQTLPVSFTDVTIPGVPVPAAGTIAGTCRSDLVRVDRTPLSVRITGAVSDARSGLGLEACDGALHLSAGTHTLTAAPGIDDGIDVDRVVLSSKAGGSATGVAPRGAPLTESGATVEVVDTHSSSASVKVQTDGHPFWLVFGQSHSDGWEASTSGGKVGPHQLVNGYANGWLVHPDHAGTMTVDLKWTPQRLVWVGFAISALAILLCMALIVLGWRHRRSRRTDADADTPASMSDAPTLDLSFAYGPSAPLVIGAIGVGVVVAVFVAVWSRPWIGLVAGALTVAAGLVPRTRLLVAVATPLALVASRMLDKPELAWLALALLVVDLGARWLRRRHRAPAAPRSGVGVP